MNKKMIELNEKIKNKKEEMQAFINKKDVVNAKKVKEEIELLNSEYFLADQEFELSKSEIENTGKPRESRENKDTTEFLNLVRQPQMQNNMVSGDDPRGGYTVPEDISTRINNLLEAEYHLMKFITVTPVSTNSGERTFRRRNSGYIHEATSVAELAEIQLNQTPEFGRLSYKTEKFADRYLASNEVLDDTDANLETEMVDWIGGVSRVTRNNIVRVVLQSSTQLDAFDNPVRRADVASTSDIKTIANVKLDKAFHNRSRYITNQDGFNVLDTLQYADGRYVLQESISDPTKKILFGRILEVVSNNDLPSVAGKAPLVIGDLKEGVEAFDRKKLQVRTSDVAGEAWIKDGVEWRAIERLDCKLRDAEAFVYTEFDIESGLIVSPMNATELTVFNAHEALVEGLKAEVEKSKQEIEHLKDDLAKAVAEAKKAAAKK